MSNSIRIDDESPPRRRRLFQRAPLRCNLQLWIHYAKDIDSLKPVEDPRHYRAYAWVIPGSEYRTQLVLGSPNPAWDRVFNIPLGLHEDYLFLHLDVCREGCKSDPGTSTGQALVGRARVQLPGIGQRIQGGAKLMRKDGAGEVEDGHVWITMRVDQESYGILRLH